MGLFSKLKSVFTEDSNQTSSPSQTVLYQGDQSAADQQTKADLDKLLSHEKKRKVLSNEKDRLFDASKNVQRELTPNEVKAVEAMKIKNPFKGV